MNNDELITTVRESVTGVHMAIPEEQIASRSRTIRARRRIPAAAGALAGCRCCPGRDRASSRWPPARPSR
jgi:hypothetical protein